MFVAILILIAIALIDLETFFGLFRLGALFILGGLLGSYTLGCAIQWLVS